MRFAGGGRATADVGGQLVEPHATGLVVGVVQRRILVRLDDGREALIRPLLAGAPAKSLFGRKKDGPLVPVALVARPDEVSDPSDGTPETDSGGGFA